MKERIKELRKALGLSGEKFGARIGLSRMAISSLENGKYNLTEQTILSICREYHVSEEWLRYGEGEMFSPTVDVSLDELARENNLTSLEADILKAYFTIPAELREELLTHFKRTIDPSK